MRGNPGNRLNAFGFINTPLQRGVLLIAGKFNRFSGFCDERNNEFYQTVKTVFMVSGP